MAKKKASRKRLIAQASGDFKDSRGNIYSAAQANQMAANNKAVLSRLRLTVQYDGGFKDKAGNRYTAQEGRELLGSKAATLQKWHGKKTGTVKPGRKKGVPNLKRTDTGYLNQHGVEFTEEQKRALKRANERANYYREKQLRQEAAMETLEAGKKTGRTNAQLQLMGKESDFIISRKSRSLQSFKSMQDYEEYMDKLSRIQSGEYLDDMTRLYKRNHMKALENVFGDDAKGVIMKIRMMKPEKYREMIQRDEFAEINYIYDPSARRGKLNQIRAALGMKQMEDDIFGDDEYT